MKAGTAARDRSPETGAAPHSALGLARNGGSAQSAAGTWAGAVSRDGSQFEFVHHRAERGPPCGRA